MDEDAVRPDYSVLPVNKPIHPLQALPLDLMLLIVERLTTVDFIKFAFASYAIMLRHQLVPLLTPNSLRLFFGQVRSTRARPANNAGTAQAIIPIAARSIPLPSELLMQVMHSLPPIDKMRLVLANYKELKDAGIAPEISVITLAALRAVVAEESCSRHRPRPAL